MLGKNRWIDGYQYASRGNCGLACDESGDGDGNIVEIKSLLSFAAHAGRC
jgi:hypothetical protein